MSFRAVRHTALVMVTVLAGVLTGSCRCQDGTGGAAPAAGGGEGVLRRGFWSCGTAAGVCSCVPISDDLGTLAGSCAPSSCCFLDGSGHCHCQLTPAARDCSTLGKALGRTRAAESCPP